MSSGVLDASALLALLNQEPGGDEVAGAIASGSAIGAVNLSEVVVRLVREGMPEAAIRAAVGSLRLEVVPFDGELAYGAGLLDPLTRRAGLSLGDRACLALARQLGLPALTADRAWSGLELGIAIHTIR